mmetsp:Transcript_30139/g.88147  ORF Transcript_30139/g.88147 Transcript_30139/m.88147 type:complete len:130 (+) Transcript_30139:1129-1518(+)
MHPMGVSLRAGGSNTLKPIELWNVVQCGMNAYCAKDGKQVLDIARRIDWMPTQSHAFYDDSGIEIDDAIAKMAKLGEDQGVPNSFVGPSSCGYLCYSKSGVKWNGSLEVTKKVLVEGKSIEKVSSQIRS